MKAQTSLRMTSVLLLCLLLYSQAASQVTEAWERFMDGGINQPDTAVGISLDGAGNIYITGQSFGGPSNWDYLTIKYNPNGDTCWTRRYNGVLNDVDQATAITADHSGNVYVTGTSMRLGNSYDWATIKYSTNGNLLWVAFYDDQYHSYDVPTDVVLDEEGNVYVCGESGHAAYETDFCVVKYNSNGILQWSYLTSDPNGNGACANKIIIDDNLNVYATGYITQLWYWYQELFFTMKCDSNGIEQWSRTYVGTDTNANNWNRAYSIVLDHQGNVYIAGVSENNLTSGDYTTIKYDTYGNEQWTKLYNGPGYDWDAATAIAVDSDGNAYVTGYSDLYYSMTNYDFLTIKYNQNGDTLWTARYGGLNPAYGDPDQAYHIKFDRMGGIYVAGISDGYPGAGTSGWDYCIVKYNANGNQLWVARWGFQMSGEVLKGIVIDSNLNIYATGCSYMPDWIGYNTNFTTIKWQQDTLGVKEILSPSSPPSSFALHPCHPNPFNPSTAISYQLSAFSHVRLTIYDTAGRLITTLVNERQAAGTHSATFDGSRLASGIYLAKMEAKASDSGNPTYTEVQKLVLLK